MVPDWRSRTPKLRSPTTPWRSIRSERHFSPCIDLTGYLHNSRICITRMLSLRGSRRWCCRLRPRPIPAVCHAVISSRAKSKGSLTERSSPRIVRSRSRRLRPCPTRHHNWGVAGATVWTPRVCGAEECASSEHSLARRPGRDTGSTAAILASSPGRSRSKWRRSRDVHRTGPGTAPWIQMTWFHEQVAPRRPTTWLES